MAVAFESVDVSNISGGAKIGVNSEGAICASVRKMSLPEASEIAGRIVSLYGEIARQRDDMQSSLPLTEAGDETRVPPFLVKSV